MSADAETKNLPSWLVWLGSAIIVFHFFALLIVILAVPSGPWDSPFGPSPQEPPAFAQEISAMTTRYYLQPLQMSSNYHFESNRTDYDSVYFEAKLRDSKGNVLETLRFPNDQANYWVRNREILLAQKIGIDDPVQPPRGEVIAAPDKEPPKIRIWDPPRGNPKQLRQVPEHLVPRDGPVFAPSELSSLLADSYARYLKRHYGAVSVELIRHSRTPILPVALVREPPPDALEESVCSFGEHPLEK